MPNSNGQSYICHLPKVEKAKSGKLVSQHNISSLIVESEKRIKLKTPDELLEELKDQCFVRVSSIMRKLYYESCGSVIQVFLTNTYKEN